jgi:AcrR family transcriptional regulator
MAAHAARRGEPRDTLTRDRVLRAGIELADEHGIDALTMRELAGKLGVEGASLYYHVTSKRDLLDGMTDLVAAEIEVPLESPDWKDAMRRRAASARSVFSRHPWASAVMDSREHSGPAQLAYADRVLGILLAAGFTPRAAANAFLILDTHIHGFQRQQASLSLPEGVETFDVAEELLAGLAPDSYPSLLAVAADFAVNPHDDVAVFEFGLDLILDGLQRTLGSGQSRVRPPAVGDAEHHAGGAR